MSPAVAGWGGLDAEAFKALFFHSLDGVFFTDPDSGVILAANPAACTMVGYREEELAQLGRGVVMDPTDTDRWGQWAAERTRTGSFRGEVSFRRADGSTFPAEVTSQTFADAGGAVRNCIIVRDISDRRRLEHELWELALVDELTGLHNRRAFMLLADHAIREAVRADRPVIALFADVDDLKTINDTYGHGEGDRALSLVAEALRGACRDADIVARLSGDEFALLLAEATEVDDIEGRVRARLAAVACGLPYPLSVSVGVAICLPGEDCDLEEVVVRADRAMYADKTRRRSEP